MAIEESNKRHGLERCESVETEVVANRKTNGPLQVKATSFDMKDLVIAIERGDALAAKPAAEAQPLLQGSVSAKDTPPTESPKDSPIAKHQKKHHRNLAFIRRGKSKPQGKDSETETPASQPEAKAADDFIDKFVCIMAYHYVRDTILAVIRK